MSTRRVAGLDRDTPAEGLEPKHVAGSQLSRRSLLALPLAVAGAACGPAQRPAAPKGPTPVKLSLSPLADLVKAPGLAWMMEISPRRAFEDDTILAALDQVIPEERFRSFASHNGGIDPRLLDELVIARYSDVTLTLGRGTVDPGALQKAFERRALHMDARVVDPTAPVGGQIVRMFGDTTKERMQLVTFGREAFALETGRFGPLRVAELFAQGKLHKAKPALRAAPLDRAAALLGDGAAARFFAAGPFEGEWENALGGLLRASTGVALSLRTARGGHGHVKAVVVVLGAFEKAPEDAARRFGALVDVLLSKNPFGRMLGLHEPIESPRVFGLPDALRVEATFDGERIARGAHQALEAEISEIMKNPG
jgi:hypothetical protein